MSKIKINLGYSPANGKQISFIAPCSSSDAECLMIDDVEYAIVDSDGVSIAGIENLWNSGSMVSFILNTNDGKAYIQNAGTNSYLETRLADTVSKSGDIMAGPLSVKDCVYARGDSWNFFGFSSTDSSSRGAMMLNPDNVLHFNVVHPEAFRDLDGTKIEERYKLPSPTKGLVQNDVWYDILTSKNPVSVAQGGTGANNPEDARKNLGAAPSGFGLGEAVLKSWIEVDSLTEPGWYRFSESGTINFDGDNFNYAFMRVDSYDSTAVCQALYIVGASCPELVRRKNAGVWHEWEWRNPRLLPGKEYRTTERFANKTVYAKVFNFGALPNEGGTKSLTHGLNTTAIVSLYATSVSGKYYFPCKSSELEVDLYMNATEIKIVATKGNWGSNKGYVVVKYTKD